MKKIYLKRGKEDSLLRYHPWVFSGALSYSVHEDEEGDVVEVCNAAGDFMAIGHIQRGTIAVRVLTFENEPIDDGFWRRRLAAAYRVRKAMGIADAADTDTFRLVHGEGDSLPGLVIDCYGATAVMQAHSLGMHRARHAIAQALADVMGERIRNIYYKSEGTLPFVAGEENGFLLGGGREGDVAMEHGLRFHVDWLKGQKTGFFVDQRDNRLLLEQFAEGRKVLNMCCYTGGFSFYAIRGGAALVHSVDSSEKAIQLTKANVELNFPGDKRHEAFCDDAFKFLDRPGLDYDLIVLDPPAFAKHRGAIPNALK